MLKKITDGSISYVKVKGIGSIKGTRKNKILALYANGNELSKLQQHGNGSHKVHSVPKY